MELRPATRKTFYFIGVSTQHSSIMDVFPAWARFLGLGDVDIKGVDLPLHAPAADYRAVTTFIKHDPLSVGALVTTHKIDLYHACHDLFDEIDLHAGVMGETSCLYKRDGKFCCSAKDPVSSGFALEHLLPPQHFANTGAAVFSMGAGGSTIALTWHLTQPHRGANRPSRVIVSDISKARLDEIQTVHRKYGVDLPCEYVLMTERETNDRVLAGLPAGSLVINGTGLGKDAPGSPLTDSAQFPPQGIIWELNYRGELVFLDQAKAQRAQQALTLHDGWVYFLYGWTRVIAEVFDVDVPVNGPEFEKLSTIAARAGKVEGAAKP